MLFSVRILIYLIIAFVLSIIVTKLSCLVLAKCNFWSKCDNNAKRSVVRGGGVAIATTFILLSYVLANLYNKSALLELNSFMPSAILILILGIIDDKYDCNAKIKLLIQIIAISLLWLQNYRIEMFLGCNLPSLVSFGVTLIWGLAILNGMNLIDGLDGLCAGNTSFIVITMTTMAYASHNRLGMALGILLLGSCLGFLLFNYHPAKLFLGDTGSLFLGLTCLFLSLHISDGNFNINNVAALILLFWVPFCDLGLAIWRRKVKNSLLKSKVNVMERDLNHIHHRILNTTQDHRKTVAIILFAILVINALGLVVFIYKFATLTVILLAVVGIITLSTIAQYEIRYTVCLMKYLSHNNKKRKSSQKK